MKITKIIFSVFFVMLFFAVAASVQAQSSVDECKARINLIQADLDAIYAAGSIGGNNPQQTYLSITSKLQGAKAKLDQRKFADALQKLQEVKAAVIALRDAAKPKLSAADAALLLDGDDSSPIDEGLNGAIACAALLP